MIFDVWYHHEIINNFRNEHKMTIMNILRFEDGSTYFFFYLLYEYGISTRNVIASLQ